MQHRSTGNPRAAQRGRHASIPLDDPLNDSLDERQPESPRAGRPRQASNGARTAPSPKRQQRPNPPAPPRRPKGLASELGLDTQQTNPYQPSYENPNVRYMSGEVLSRPLDLPRKNRVGLYIAVAVALVIAGVFVYLFLDATANAPAREIEQMEETLARPVSLDLPDMASLLPLDDAAIDARLKESGATFFERKPVGSPDGYEIIKLPQDVTLLEAGELYAIGIGKLSASQAATLLNGSWDLRIERKAGINMSLHYADFKSGSLDNAITSALTAENLAQNGEPDRGEDDGFGNAYATGALTVADKNYTWTVSACPLKQIYSVAGLPDDAAYVGIRIKSA